MEGDALPLCWQLPPCTQGCSASAWDLPRHLRVSHSVPRENPTVPRRPPKHGGGAKELSTEEQREAAPSPSAAVSVQRD